MTKQKSESKSASFESFTLICLFSSRNLCTSICSRLHSSMIFFTSPSSIETLPCLAGCSDLTEVEGVSFFLLSPSCCGEKDEGGVVTNGDEGPTAGSETANRISNHQLRCVMNDGDIWLKDETLKDELLWFKVTLKKHAVMNLQSKTSCD